MKNAYDFLDQRKQVKVQWLQDPNKSNVDNQNNIRQELVDISRKKKEYLNTKIDELETNRSKISHLHRGANDFKKVYQPRTKEERMRRVICLRSPTVFWVGGGIISLSY